MLRFLRRIRETDEGDLPPGKDPLRPDQLAVYYVEQGGTGVSVSPIRISEDGEFIDRWPKGFFSERAEELF
jgi:predicted ATPase